MNNALQDLAQCADTESLGTALHTLCSEFGAVSWLDILTMTNPGKRQAVCLLRLDSWEHEQNLIKKTGANRFGEELCIVVDLRTQESALV